MANIYFSKTELDDLERWFISEKRRLSAYCDLMFSEKIDGVNSEQEEELRVSMEEVQSFLDKMIKKLQKSKIKEITLDIIDT